MCSLHVEFKFIVHYDAEHHILDHFQLLDQYLQWGTVVIVGVCSSNVETFVFIYIKAHFRDQSVR